MNSQETKWNPSRDTFTPNRSIDGLIILTIGVITIFLSWPNQVVGIDIAVREYFYEIRDPTIFAVSSIIVKLGQGGVIGFVALFIATYQARKYHTIRPMIAFMFTALAIGSIAFIKIGTGRVAPEWTNDDSRIPPFASLDQAIIFSGLENASSYPSGHLINAVAWYGLMIFLCRNVKTPVKLLVTVGPSILVFSSMIYLGWHWLTDCIVGVLCGILILRILKSIDWENIWLPNYIEPNYHLLQTSKIDFYSVRISWAFLR